MAKSYKRVNVMIGEEQYQTLSERGLNVSGLIRDLLGDYLSQSVITVQVSAETKRVYDLVVANTGSTDQEMVPVKVAEGCESRGVGSMEPMVTPVAMLPGCRRK